MSKLMNFIATMTPGALIKIAVNLPGSDMNSNKVNPTRTPIIIYKVLLSNEKLNILFSIFPSLIF